MAQEKEMRHVTSIASANALKHKGKQPGASSAACGLELKRAKTARGSRIERNTCHTTHLAQLISCFSLGGATTGYEKPLLIKSAHHAQGIVDAAFVLVQRHLVAASARG